jgi:hypothetical protein
MALSANTPRSYDVGDTYNTLPVKASSTIYEGSAVGMTAGYARALVAADEFAGFATAKAVGTGTDGVTQVTVKSRGRVQLAITSLAVTDIGQSVYASADGTFTLTQTGNSQVGKVVRWISTGEGVIEFEAHKIEPMQVISIPITLANVADGDVLTAYTPGFKGSIISVDFAVTTAVTTAAKASTLNIEIGTTNVTGGAVAITSAGATPLGAIIAGTAVTAANAFGATDTISIEAASTTTFVEGAGVLLIKVRQES